MERKEEITINSVHDLTEEELVILAALRDPVKGEKLREVYCGGEQSRHAV